VTVSLIDLTVKDFVIQAHNVTQTVISLQLPTYRDIQHVMAIFVNYNFFILWLEILFMWYVNCHSTYLRDI